MRPSGTESLLRIMAEGENKAQLEKITEQLKEIMLKELG